MKTSHLVLAVTMGALAFTGCRSTQEALRIGEAGEANPGPCPRAFALYDASRIVDIQGPESFSNVGFTGEMGSIRSFCRYYGTQPIVADMEIEMELGRGPAAQGNTAVYEYFVAVTRKNIGVIHKEVFPLQVTFPQGADRVSVTEKIDRIVIPRAEENTSGANFEIITGFVVTPEQREFNAQGKRFRVSAGQAG
ncbi:MAG: hypothetical protein GDA35_02370 [Hyphomonadaceae bacterium]|nr:hypothetical protein [Hyphomonadaceae bacterium]